MPPTVLLEPAVVDQSDTAMSYPFPSPCGVVLVMNAYVDDRRRRGPFSPDQNVAVEPTY